MPKYILVLCLLLSACIQFSGDSGRFLAQDDETVLDEETGLMWAAADNGQSLTWPEAEAYCSSYTGGGYDDWRLPKKTELIALAQAGIIKEEGMITVRGKRVWAAETDGTKGAGCSLESGGCGWSEKMISIALSALPVRDTRVAASAPASSHEVRPQTPAQRLQMIDQLHRQQLITKEEYEQKKVAILNEI